MSRWLMVLVALMACGSVLAQESTSFKIKSAVLNAGGRPLDGTASSSASFMVRPDAIGDPVVTHAAVSEGGSFRLNAGFVQAFPPPGEVRNLEFIDPVTMTWDADPLAMHYHAYRAGPMGTATAVTPVGHCLQADVIGPTTMETAIPPPNLAFFYTINAVNCTGIEGHEGATGTHCP